MDRLRRRVRLSAALGLVAPGVTTGGELMGTQRAGPRPIAHAATGCLYCANSSFVLLHPNFLFSCEDVWSTEYTERHGMGLLVCCLFRVLPCLLWTKFRRLRQRRLMIACTAEERRNVAVTAWLHSAS